jgi:hypothetical protein
VKRSEINITSRRIERETVRVARFLSTAGTATVRAAAKDGIVLLDGGERGTISVAPATLAVLVRKNIIRQVNGRLVLSAEGVALARRAEAPQDPFRAQHMDLGSVTVSTDGGAERVEANLSESPLAQLARRRGRDGKPFLSENEVRAGERLREDFTRGRIMPRLGVNWSTPVAGGRRGSGENGIADLTDAALAARQRVNRALEAVGPELAGVLVDVCCFLKGLERVESERGWPVRSAKVVLKTALAALSRHYEPQQPARRRSILHWGADGFRPSLR